MARVGPLPPQMPVVRCGLHRCGMLYLRKAATLRISHGRCELRSPAWSGIPAPSPRDHPRMLLAVHTCRDFLNLLATCEPFSLNFSNSIGEWRHRTPHDTLPYSLRRDQLSLIARWLLQPIHRHRSGRLWLAHKTRARGVGSICRLVLNLEAARVLPQMNVKPRKLKVSGLPSPRRSRR